MKSQGTFLEPLVWFVWMAIPITLLCGIVYVTAQQNYRQNLNDPQIQMAEDIAAALQQSGALLDQVPQNKVDIQTSLAPFIILYDTEGNPIAGNGYQGSSLMKTPKGVFTNAHAWGENRRTLEPQAGVRIASIVVPFVGREANGYVLVGRNMREVESRIADMEIMLFLAWLATQGAVFVASYIAWFLLRRSAKPTVL